MKQHPISDDGTASTAQVVKNARSKAMKRDNIFQIIIEILRQPKCGMMFVDERGLVGFQGEEVIHTTKLIDVPSLAHFMKERKPSGNKHTTYVVYGEWEAIKVLIHTIYLACMGQLLNENATMQGGSLTLSMKGDQIVIV